MPKIKYPTRMKKQELIELLIEQGNDPKEVSKLKRPALVELYRAEILGQEAEKSLSSAQEQDNESIVDRQLDNQNENTITVATPGDSGWTQYVLGKFTDDEMDGENPRVEGLRRVAEELVGEIIEEGCDLVSAPTIENQFRACAKAWVTFMATGTVKRFEALADAYPGNIADEDFAVYLTAMADTRAKGRCYRAALKLRRVVAAEEIRKGSGMNEDSTPDAIHEGQITTIRMLADRLNISISKLIKDLEINCKTTDSGVIDLKSLDRADAVIAIKRLNELRSTKVPEKLRRE